MLARRTSISNSGKKVYLDKNNISGATEIRVENIADAQLITSEQLEEEIMSELRFTEDNLERLDALEQLKGPYLFRSDDLLQIVEVTTSLKTRIEMISIIGPRLTDPSAKVSSFTDMFRFAEDKKSVEEVLKARMQAINAAKFSNQAASNSLRPGSGRGGPGRGLKMVPASGGRSGRGMGPAGRGMSPMRPVSVPVPHAEHSPVPQPHTPQPARAPPLMTTPISEISTTSAVVKPEPIPILTDKQRSPEMCPEEGTVSSSPVSLSETDDGADDSHSTGIDSAPAHTRKMTPIPDVNHNLSLLGTASVAVGVVRPAPVDISSVQSQGGVLQVPFDSPHTDGDSSCTTPSERHSLSSEVDPSTAVFVNAFPTEPLPPAAATATGKAIASAESQRTTPVPLIEIAARAPQRAPIVQSKRAGNSTAPSPVPTSNNTPTISPSTSNAHLPGLGTRDSNISTAAAPAIVVAPPTAKGSYASQSGTYDLAPMVADCKPEVGVHSLLSRFSGSGGTKPNATPSKPPPDASVCKGRKISDLANAFMMKPATSTASSTLSSNGSSIPRASSFRNPSSLNSVDERSRAPAPIVIPGASTSLAEIRAKFSGAGKASAASTNSSPCGKSSSSDDGGDTPMPKSGRIVRRHSESWGPNSAFARALAAAGGGPGSGMAGSSVAVATAPVAAEVAGAGADVATRCAAALQMSKAEFLSLIPEEPVFVPDEVTETNLPQYTYREMVRRNFQKECSEFNQNILEMYVCDDEFMIVFQRTKDEYSRLPRWRQVEQKKKAMLF